MAPDHSRYYPLSHLFRYNDALEVLLKILSLGAGVQSSTILLMSCYGELERIDAAIFADTGWEPEAVYFWLNFLRYEAKKANIPLITVTIGRNIKRDALTSKVRGIGGLGRCASMPLFTKDRNNGSKGMIRRQCTYDYKIRPIEKMTRFLAGYKPRQRIPAGTVETWKGISLDEANRAKISDRKWISFYYPLIEKRMTRTDCLNWFKNKGLPRPPRSACIGCPYHNNREWRRMKIESPAEFKEAVEFDKAIRKYRGMRGDTFIHADRIPLDEVDLRNDYDHGQLSLWRDECAGICGV